MDVYQQIIIYLLEWIDWENRAIGQMVRKYIQEKWKVELPPQKKPEE